MTRLRLLCAQAAKREATGGRDVTIEEVACRTVVERGIVCPFRLRFVVISLSPRSVCMVTSWLSFLVSMHFCLFCGREVYSLKYCCSPVFLLFISIFRSEVTRALPPLLSGRQGRYSRHHFPEFPPRTPRLEVCSLCSNKNALLGSFVLPLLSFILLLLLLLLLRRCRH